MRSQHVRLLQTLPHACGYYADRTAQNLVVDPATPHPDWIYGQALALGFRRAGDHLYRPRCPGCDACTASRVPMAAFRPDRSQRRCQTRNGDLTIRDTDPGYTAERHALYRRYLQARHPDGGMDGADAGDFSRFLVAPWGITRFLEFRLDGTLLAVAVTDVCAQALSAVYTFFAPDLESRGLGTFAVLRQIAWAREQRLDHLYLGYWIAGHPKMDYKRRFRPLEVLRQGSWSLLDPR